VRIMTYGCHNSQRLDAYFVRDQTHNNNWLPPVDEFVLIADNSTKACQYRKTTPDPKCEGCTK